MQIFLTLCASIYYTVIVHDDLARILVHDDVALENYQFVRDLGLIRVDRGVLRIANPIYNEVITRTLNSHLVNLPA